MQLISLALILIQIVLIWENITLLNINVVCHYGQSGKFLCKCIHYVTICIKFLLIYNQPLHSLYENGFSWPNVWSNVLLMLINVLLICLTLCTSVCMLILTSVDLLVLQYDNLPGSHYVIRICRIEKRLAGCMQHACS